MARICLESLTYIVHHVVLPPKVPATPEALEIKSKAEQDLLAVLQASISDYIKRLGTPKRYQGWNSIEKMMSILSALITSTSISNDVLARTLSGAKPGGEPLISC